MYPDPESEAVLGAIHRQKKRITQADVARAANVSQALVSYVVNNNVSIAIPEETRRRIEDAMRELGYVPNITARRLRSNKTSTIAGIIPDVMNPFYPALERGIQDVVDQQGFDLIMVNTDGNADKERRCLQSMLQGRVDGLVGVFFHLTAKDFFPLLEQGICVVRLEAMPKQPGALPLDNLFIDNIQAACDAVNYLIDQGHKRIAMLSGRGGPSQYRVMGYRQALAQHGIPFDEELSCMGSLNEQGGYETMRRLLQLRRPPSAVFAVNDLMAMGAMAAIREAGRAIPDEIAVMGFDDIPTARLVYPPLTTVAQFQRQIGQRAAQMLFERLAGDAPPGGRSEQMPFQLMVRESA